MHLVDQIPVEIGHVLERDVAEDAGIVDEDVDAAEALDGGINDLVAVLDAVVVGNGLAAGLSDLVDDHVRGLCGAALAGVRAAQVVNDDIGAPGREEYSVCLAQATAGTGDHDGLAVIAKLGHVD